MSDYTAARLNMVESQVRPNKVTDLRILRGMLNMPRERFVPDRMKSVAYVDEDIPVSADRFLMEPMVQARLLQSIEPQSGDRALEIGCGTGYGTAILSGMVAEVTALDSDAGLVQMAQANLRSLDVSNARVVVGSLTNGYPAGAPYNLIVYSGAVEEVPTSVTDQLADGGRLAVVVAPPDQPPVAVLITRIGNALSRRTIFDASTPVLPGCHRVPGFAF
jgi:protein-L-isoaspartate(D-aspartate) O-methyltransferase